MKRSKLLEDYLEVLVVMGNDLLDFRAHEAFVLDSASQQFTHNWHYLTGWAKLDSPLTARTTAALGKILDSGRCTAGSLIVGYPRPAQKPMSWLIIPIVMSGEPATVLMLQPPADVSYTTYDVYLAECLAKVVATGFSSNGSRDLLAPLRWCALQRRHFLAAVPALPDVIGEYLSRILRRIGFPLLPKGLRASANARLVFRSTIDGEKPNSGLTLRYVAFQPHSQRTSRALRHRCTVSSTHVEDWLESWAKFDARPPDDIDQGYHQLFPSTRTHLGVPCVYNGTLHAILSVDSPGPGHFNPMVVRALCVLAAHAAPIIANAVTRQNLSDERLYLKRVLDAIPDDLSIIDEDGRILRMNQARKRTLPDANEGQYCFEAFEHGRDRECPGCYTLKAIRSGRPITQALWRYTNRHTCQPNFVEISAARIALPAREIMQGVEVVRPVGAREAMLEWLAQLHEELLRDHGDGVRWLWRRTAVGLTKMGFARSRAYRFVGDRFLGEACIPGDTFGGDDFTEFVLDPQTDLPSQILLRRSKLRPVRFVVNERQARPSVIWKREDYENYLTCHLKKVPPKCARYLGKAGTRCWVDVPIGVGSRLYGKLSVDKESATTRRGATYVTDSEMALLACFGRFASLAMHLLLQHGELSEALKQQALASVVRHLSHELDNCQEAITLDIEYLGKMVPNVIRTLLASPERWKKGAGLEIVRSCGKRLLASDLRGPATLSRSQLRRATRLQELTASVGLDYERGHVVPLVLSGTDRAFAGLLQVSRKRGDVPVFKFVVTLANMLCSLQSVVEAQQTAVRLIANLRTKSMLAPDTVEPVDIVESIEAAVRMVRTALLGVGEICLTRPKRKLPKIPSYVGSLRLAWVNLLKNAAQATEGRGTILVAITRQQDAAVVRLVDSGPGLPKRIRRMLAAPGQTQPGQSKRDLGLRTTKMIVEAHNGHIQVVSSGPNGTTLDIHLPLKGAQK